jgi:hypothetical protein
MIKSAIRKLVTDHPSCQVEGNILRPDDEALISIFYCLGYLHGMRYSIRNLNHEEIIDRKAEKFWIDQLPSEVSALHLGGDIEPAVEKIRDLISAWLKND